MFSNPATGPAHLVRHDFMTGIIFVVSGIINYIVMFCITDLLVLQDPYLYYSHRARDMVSNPSGA
jgi:hypothetical protein